MPEESTVEPESISKPFLSEDLESLRTISNSSYNNVVTAAEVFKSVPDDFPLALSGGLGVASSISEEGYLFREVRSIGEGIDLYVPKDRLEELFELLKLGDPNKDDQTTNSSKYKLEVNPRLKGGILSKTRGLFHSGVTLNIEPYVAGDGSETAHREPSVPSKAYISVGEGSGLEFLTLLSDQYPIKPEQRKLMGLPVRTAPHDVLYGYAKQGAHSRLSNQILDLERLRP